MGILRLVIFIVFVIAVIWVWKRISKPTLGSTTSTRSIESVRCAYCDVHIDQAKAILYRSEWFCNESHRNAKYPIE